jgi:hypothetical protein
MKSQDLWGPCPPCPQKIRRFQMKSQDLLDPWSPCPQKIRRFQMKSQDLLGPRSPCLRKIRRFQKKSQDLLGPSPPNLQKIRRFPGRDKLPNPLSTFCSLSGQLSGVQPTCDASSLTENTCHLRHARRHHGGRKLGREQMHRPLLSCRLSMTRLWRPQTAHLCEVSWLRVILKF